MEQKLSRIQLLVSDNGIDFPGNRSLDQFTSLGLLIVRNLTRQLGGVLELLKQKNFKVFQIEFKSEVNEAPKEA